jgi:ABC-type proline/glycine betaine transport system permease subunit/ABC-type nitrate/sulfonate/bicarbonate transport system ATPase subunit
VISCVANSCCRRRYGYVHYILDNWDYLLTLTLQHLWLVALAVGLAIIIGVPLGILIVRHKWLATPVLGIATIVLTIPSIALFGLMIPLFSLIGQGIGALPAITAVFLYSLLPIVRNTHTALDSLPPGLREAGRGIGMTFWQRLRWVEIPMALPVIFGGIRTAVVMNIRRDGDCRRDRRGRSGPAAAQRHWRKRYSHVDCGRADDLSFSDCARLAAAPSAGGSDSEGDSIMIKLENLTKHFSQKHGQTFKAVDNVNLNVPEGEMCVLLGPSGCGKTTTLKMINRLITPSSGTILINGEDTSGMDTVTLRRNIGYVIQQIGLFPNMTIEENITVVPRMLGWDKARCKTRAEELMDMVALDPHKFLNRYPREMSGGQQQRIGVIRALAADPPVLLMDEPFGAVDPINREVIQNQFLEMQRKLKKPSCWSATISMKP